MEFYFKLPCDLTGINPTQKWVTTLLRRNPDLTGWPIFIDLWNARHPEYRPVIKDGVWEARIFQETDEYDGGKDFWRIDGRRGMFYAARAFEDDTSPRNPNKRRTLEFGLVVLRVAETISVANAFANHLCRDVEKAAVPLTWKWSGLEGRLLSSWAGPEFGLYDERFSSSDVASSSLSIPLSLTNDQVAVRTSEVVKPLFLCFDGWECSLETIGQLVSRMYSRRL